MGKAKVYARNLAKAKAFIGIGNFVVVDEPLSEDAKKIEAETKRRAKYNKLKDKDKRTERQEKDFQALKAEFDQEQ